MCGIAGFVCADAPPIAERDRLRTMRDTLSHRGPDDVGEWWSADGRVGFGHRRLSIIDLSPAGHQPMQHRSGRWTITFNGEIYNYRELRHRLEGLGRSFRSQSDTEVMLEALDAWGDAAIDELNGMFAFAVHDSVANQVTLVRDRTGEKPLFYRVDGRRLLFASELKALLAHPDVPRRLDPSALDRYLTYGYVPGERCIVAGSRKLAAGHALRFDLDTGTVSVKPYWSLPAGADGRAGDDEALLDRLESLLHESVRLRLTASDVPVGILLSGGLDSSLVAAVAARTSARAVRTFTVTFPGHKIYDESSYAQAVARHIGAEHTELPLEPTTADLVPELARIYDEPIADSSMVPTLLVSRAIRRHATVALGGDGGDELFGGYPHYQWVQWHAAARRWLPSLARRVVASGAARLPLGVRSRNHLVGLAGPAARGVAHVNVYFDRRTRDRLLRADVRAALAASERPEVERAALCRPGSLLHQATSADFLAYLPDDLLVKVDRASMAVSLEMRCPWLDHSIIEFAFSEVPDRLRVDGARRKVLLQRLAARLLPASFDATRKQGFSIPLDAWFRGPWGDWMRDVLTASDQRLFDQRTVRALLAGQAKGRSNVQRLYSLAFFETWRRTYGIVG